MWLCVLVSVLGVALGQGQGNTNLVTSKECCGQLIMDSSNRVMLDESIIIKPGTYFCLITHLCTFDPVYVQHWKKLGDSGVYQLIHQVKVQATNNNQLGHDIQINLDDPWIVNNDDNTSTNIIGFYTVLGSRASGSPDLRVNVQKNPIPYNFGDEHKLYISDRSFLDEKLKVIDTSVRHEDISWPRSYKNFVHLSPQACGTLSADDPDTGTGGTNNGGNSGGDPGTTGSPGGPGECCNQPGPQGPPGPPGPPGSFDPIDGTLSCDVPDQVTDDLSKQGNALNDIDNKINEITNILHGITGSTFVTGLCPQGFVSSSYGVGSCYIVYKERVQMSTAVLRCRDDHSATLVSIETELEESFLKMLVANITALTGGTETEEFWTAGMYNKNAFIWVWYDENTRTKQAMNYRNWETGREPLPESDDDVCMAFTLNYKVNEDYWKKKNCNTFAYYICETPKKCL